MSIIIIGAGEVGYNVARRLSREMQDIVVGHGAQIHLGPLTAHDLRKDAEHA